MSRVRYVLCISVRAVESYFDGYVYVSVVGAVASLGVCGGVLGTLKGSGMCYVEPTSQAGKVAVRL